MNRMNASFVVIFFAGMNIQVNHLSKEWEEKSVRERERERERENEEISDRS